MGGFGPLFNLMKIFINTFKRGNNQGQVLPVGMVDISVYKFPYVFGQNGCHSSEIKLDPKGLTCVLICGSYWVCREVKADPDPQYDWVLKREREAGADYMVNLPIEIIEQFAPLIDNSFLPKCPLCGKMNA